MSAVLLSSSITSRLEELGDVEQLGTEWRELQSKAESSFFLSWCWIHTWLTVLIPKASRTQFLVVRTFDADILIGIGIISLSQQRYLKFLPSKVLRFQQTNDAQLDHIWPEYNGLLVQKGREHEVYKSAFAQLDTSCCWDEVIAGVIEKQVDQQLLNLGLAREVISASSSYWVDLELLRQSQSDYLASLSRNTRHQIRRSIKSYNEVDPLRLHLADSLAQAHDFFDKIAPLHTARWGQGSGFNNPAFVEFHRALIDKGFAQQQIELACMFVGDQAIGYLYNFIFSGRLYFYLSGIDYTNPVFQSKHMKPGLVMHALRIQHCLDYQPEIVTYDFMAGDSRYKQSLASKAGDMIVAHYRKPKKRFDFLLRAKQLKSGLASAKLTDKGNK